MITVRLKPLLLFSGTSSLLGGILSLETFFVLFLFAGLYKADSRFNWVSVDLTALFAALILAWGFYIFFICGLKVKRNALNLLIIFILFISCAFLSLIYTPGFAYARQKVLYISTLNLLAFTIAALIIASSRARIKRFMMALIVFSIVMFVEVFKNYLQSGGIGFVTAFNTNYLGVGRVLGLGAILWLSIFLFTKKLIWRIFSIGALAFYLFLMFVSGGRGPVVAFISTSLMFLLLGFLPGKTVRYYRFSFRLIGLWILLIIFLLMFISPLSTTTLQRFLVIYEDPSHGYSVAVRLEYYKDAFHYWLASPIWGHGIGSWPILEGEEDTRKYPHNIFLEIAVELGLIGVCLFMGFLFYGLKCLGDLDRVRSDPLKMTTLMLLINMIVNAQFSGDLHDNRVLFALVGLITMTDQANMKRKS